MSKRQQLGLKAVILLVGAILLPAGASHGRLQPDGGSAFAAWQAEAGESRPAAAAAPDAPADDPAEGQADAAMAARAAFNRSHTTEWVSDYGLAGIQIAGRAFASGATPALARDDFLARYLDIVGASNDELQPADTMALWGKFTLFLYTQAKHGIPVHDRWLKVLVRNAPYNAVVLVNSTLVSLAGVPSNPELEASAAVATVQAAFPTLVQVSTPELVYHTLDGRTALLCWRFFASNDDLTQIEHDEFFVDALTGNIVDRRPGHYETNIDGNISGYHTNPPYPDQANNPPQNMPVYGARGRVQGGNSAYANTGGNFTIQHGGTTSVTVITDLQGQWANVFNQGTGGALTATLAVTPPGPANFTLNSGPTEYRTAQLNAMNRVTYVHNFIKALVPTLTVMDIQMTTNVNVSGSCNAFYNLGSNPSLNFYRAGGGCPNMAYASVIYHEYGHGVTDRVPGSPDASDYHEGMSDTLAQFVENSSCVGPDFSGQGSGCLRNTDTPNRVYPCTQEAHTCGLVIAGAFWDMRTALSATLGISLALNTSRQYYIGQELTGNHAINPAVTSDVLTLDDDNADITDGTPNYDEIDAGFSAHNLPAPPIIELRYHYPAGRPAIVPPSQTSSLPFEIEGVAGEPDDSTVRLTYKIGAGAFVTNTVAISQTGVYTATLPSAACRTPIRYYLSATSNHTITVRDPGTAPTQLFFTMPATGVQTFISRTFETNPGWTITNTTGLTGGAWERGVPANGDRGDPPTDYDGSGQCWLTQNVAGNSDVDGGSTYLTSEVMNLSSLADPYVRYARWYSNATGGAPQADIFTIQVSSTAGTGWVNLEVVGPTLTSPNPEVDGGWFVRSFRIADFVTPGAQFRIRFIAADLGSGSVVEAAVDSFEIYDYTCPATPTPTPSSTPTATDTPTITPTPTDTPTPSSTPTPTSTPTVTPTDTPTPTPTPIIKAGDCNVDYLTDAGDLSALVLELFDGDGNEAAAAGGGSYPGASEGCDANADTRIDAADMACNVRLIFLGPGACDQN